MERNYLRENSVVYHSSFSSLDGIPFKIGPKFQQKDPVVPPVLNKIHHSHVKDEEYDFSVEEGVLQWANERQKQLIAQQRAEEDRKARLEAEILQESSESEDECDGYQAQQNENAQNSQILIPNVAPKPIFPGISNDILTPIPIKSNTVQTQNGSDQKSVDFSLFEKEDDPFDRFERLTLNDLNELKSVFDNGGSNEELKSNSKTTQSVNENVENNIYENTKIANHPPNGLVNHSADGDEGGDYIELESKTDQSPEKVKPTKKPKPAKRKVPPIPPRPSLAAKNPLPPIGGGGSKDLFSALEVQNSIDTSSDTYENVNLQGDFQSVSFSNSSSSPSFQISNDVKLTPRGTNPFISTNEQTTEDTRRPSQGYVNVAPKPIGIPLPGMVNSGTSPEMSVKQDLPLPLSVSPPPRPSSKQEPITETTRSWNRYTPLPLPGSRGTTPISPASDSSSENYTSVADIDPYNNLSIDAKRIVDNLVSMGFARPRVARAVEKLGNDEKNIVEHLCLVDKLTDKGQDAYLAEGALVLFSNNMEKAEKYLSIYKQFQELGFTGERIKEALLKNDLDSDKSLDFLTS